MAEQERVDNREGFVVTSHNLTQRTRICWKKNFNWDQKTVTVLFCEFHHCSCQMSEGPREGLLCSFLREITWCQQESLFVKCWSISFLNCGLQSTLRQHSTWCPAKFHFLPVQFNLELLTKAPLSPFEDKIHLAGNKLSRRKADQTLNPLTVGLRSDLMKQK